MLKMQVPLGQLLPINVNRNLRFSVWVFSVAASQPMRNWIPIFHATRKARNIGSHRPTRAPTPSRSTFFGPDNFCSFDIKPFCFALETEAGFLRQREG